MRDTLTIVQAGGKLEGMQHYGWKFKLLVFACSLFLRRESSVEGIIHMYMYVVHVSGTQVIELAVPVASSGVWSTVELITPTDLHSPHMHSSILCTMT